MEKASVRQLYNQYSQLSDDELWEISLRKEESGITKGNATKEALVAQRIIWERAGKSYDVRNVGRRHQIEDEENIYGNDPEYDVFHR